MSEAGQRYGRIADGFSRTLGSVNDQQWGGPSPCDGWTAFEVAAHVVATHKRILTMLGDRESEAPASAAELGPAWATVSAEVRSALADPAQAARSVGSSFGEQSFESLVSRMLCCDTLLHTWDLARAVGSDDMLDAAAVAHAHEMLAGLGEGIRRPGGFGPDLTPEGGVADPQAAFLLFAGRQP